MHWIAEAARVLRPGGQIYVVSGYSRLVDVLLGLKQARLEEVNHIIWKYNFGVYTSRKFVSSHYHILYYAKPGGTRTFNLESRFGKSEAPVGGGSSNYRDREDVWVINREYKPGQRKNKNELPEALLLKMLQYSSTPGDTVADFFMGGGSTGRVARGLGRKFIGFELSLSAYSHADASIRGVGFGERVPFVRNPAPSASPENEGEPWTEGDYGRLADAYHALLRRGVRKKDLVEILSTKFGRGYWSISKALKRIPPPTPEARLF